jgi:hypothetical protein
MLSTSLVGTFQPATCQVDPPLAPVPLEFLKPGARAPEQQRGPTGMKINGQIIEALYYIPVLSKIDI